MEFFKKEGGTAFPSLQTLNCPPVFLLPQNYNLFLSISAGTSPQEYIFSCLAGSSASRKLSLEPAKRPKIVFLQAFRHLPISRNHLLSPLNLKKISKSGPPPNSHQNSEPAKSVNYKNNRLLLLYHKKISLLKNKKSNLAGLSHKIFFIWKLFLAVAGATAGSAVTATWGVPAGAFCFYQITNYKCDNRNENYTHNYCSHI